jgi:hypothetical protein
MTDVQFNVFQKGAITEDFGGVEKEGYKVVYPDGYVSWSPKDAFEKSYMQVGDNNTITQQNVDDFIVDYEVFTKKGKITIVIATLVNGFTIVESSACVDPANYSEEIGAEICKSKIKDKVWNHLGFLLQCGVGGVKYGL